MWGPVALWREKYLHSCLNHDKIKIKWAFLKVKLTILFCFDKLCIGDKPAAIQRQAASQLTQPTINMLMGIVFLLCLNIPM